MAEKKKKDSYQPVLREHAYDGIQEYDQRLPNWWLFTLYGAIVFSVIYWFVLVQAEEGDPHVKKLKRELAFVDQLKLASGLAEVDDAFLWKMSRDPEAVATGKDIYVANCMACHGADLKGGIGLNLVDGEFVHGSAPMDHYNVVQKGVLEKGMPNWGGVLGDRRIAQVVAYIMSFHTPPDL